MKCNKCGTEFTEGVFCPECGNCIDDGIEEKNEKLSDATVEIERQKTETARIEKERVEKELELTRHKVEQERWEMEKQKRIEKEKAEQLKEKQENEGKTMAVLALVAGAVSIVTFGVFLLPELLGIIFAFLGKKQGKMRGTAKAGLVLSMLSIGVYIIVFYFS